jgi:hypothetical protein
MLWACPLDGEVKMKLTVVGIMVVVGTVALLAFVAYQITQGLNRKQGGTDEQPINPA